MDEVTLAVGVDVAEERKGLDLVAMDGDRRIVASEGRLTVDDVARMVSELSPEVVCIDSPSGWSRPGLGRQTERDLRALGIRAFSTPPDPGPHPFYAWMRVGFRVFDAIAASHPPFRGGPVRGAAEVFPEASAVLLAGRRRGQGTKCAFRREVLAEQGVDTRRSALPNVDRVDAALAALTGVIALQGTYSTLGNPDEGLLLLPVAEPVRYPG